MKIIVWLIGAVTLLAVSGCDWDRDHHHREGNYGGYYGEDPYHHYGHGEYHPQETEGLLHTSPKATPWIHGRRIPQGLPGFRRPRGEAVKISRP